MAFYCVRCGAQIDENQNYCPACGTPARVSAQTQMAAAAPGRIAGHVRLLGILWIVISAFRLLPGVILLSVFRHGMPFMPDDVPPFVHGEFIGGLIQIIGSLFVAGGLLGILAGVGLLQRQPWARMLTIVLGCVGLLDLPFGTALGIYTLWVLLPAESEREYQELTRAA